MKVRTRLLLTAVTLALCLTSVPAFLASAAQQMGNTANPASAAVTYSELEAAGMFSELYDHMHSDAKAIIPESAVVGWYENEFAPLGPGVITHTRVKMVSWTWEVTGTTYRTAEVSYTQPFADGTMVNDVVRLVREQDEWRWFFGRTQEFVEEQIARYAESSEAVSSSQTTAPAPANVVQSGNPGCTVVELYPGYPGYRGNITGVMPHWNGQGDYECLETLEQSNPLFNRAREDGANQQAADALGIDGSMNLWTWENWMLIEAERGLLPSCYTCLMLDTTTSPIRTDIHPEPDDYRILTGLMGQTTALTAIAVSIGYGYAMGQDGISRFYQYDDYVLRATAYLKGDSKMNAEQLYEEMQYWAEQPYRDTFAEPSVDPRGLLRIALFERGGYSEVPASAVPQDQIMGMFYPLAIMASQSPPSTGELLFSQFDRTLLEWRSGGMATPLAQFMQQSWEQYTRE